MLKITLRNLTAAACCLLSSASFTAEDEWISLFNGTDLNDWTVKFKGQEVGVNYRNTFRVEDSMLTVSYDEWDDFDGEFGHLFYNQEFSHYLLRVEYRFIGDQVTNGPAWAYRNNGMMLHSQDPRSMTVDQEFPVSIEAQLLGGNGSDPRPTGNVCTPGTHWVKGDELITTHCTNSTSQTFHGDQWVTMEMEVRGSDTIKQTVNGELVFELSAPQLDTNDADAKRLIRQDTTLLLDRGYISIQAESSPTQFRKIELLPLTE